VLPRYLAGDDDADEVDALESDPFQLLPIEMKMAEIGNKTGKLCWKMANYDRDKNVLVIGAVWHGKYLLMTGGAAHCFNAPSKWFSTEMCCINLPHLQPERGKSLIKSELAKVKCVAAALQLQNGIHGGRLYASVLVTGVPERRMFGRSRCCSEKMQHVDALLKAQAQADDEHETAMLEWYDRFKS
jgi:hypothetical protein